MPEEITLSIPSHPRFLNIVRKVVECVALPMGFSEQGCSRVVLALDEACSNIIRHSCGEDPAIKIDITFELHEDRLGIRVRDYGECGKGFNPEAVPTKDTDEPTPGGFGVGLIRSIMDNVEFSPCTPDGNVLTMTKLVC